MCPVFGLPPYSALRPRIGKWIFLTHAPSVPFGPSDFFGFLVHRHSPMKHAHIRCNNYCHNAETAETLRVSVDPSPHYICDNNICYNEQYQADTRIVMEM